MDPATLLGIGGKLLGGVLGKSRPKYVIPPYQQIRDQAEAAGFNPLFALSNAPGSVVNQDNGALGQAVAEAGAMAAETVASKKNAQLAEAQAANRQLRQQVNRLTLRPRVDGIYQHQSRALLAEARGDEGLSVVDRVGGVTDGRHNFGYVRPAPFVGSLDTRRETRIKPVDNEAGHLVIDPGNGWLPFYVPYIGDEVPGGLWGVAAGYAASRINQFASDGPGDGSVLVPDYDTPESEAAATRAAFVSQIWRYRNDAIARAYQAFPNLRPYHQRPRFARRLP